MGVSAAELLWHLLNMKCNVQQINTISTMLEIWCGMGANMLCKTHTHESWWRHQMETCSALLAICAGNSPVNSPRKGQWRGALMFSLICTWVNDWENNHETGDLRRLCAHYDVTVMVIWFHPVKVLCEILANLHDYINIMNSIKAYMFWKRLHLPTTERVTYRA